MLFKGTTTRPGGFVDREVEGVGGRMNAGTSLDYTYYHMVLPASRARRGIEILADISMNASLGDSALEREKKIVLEEMRLGEDSPNRSLFRRLYELGFDGHPYGRPVIGRLDLIRSLTRDHLLGFYRRHYVPEGFTLVVVGAVDPSEALAVARETFGRLPRGAVPRLPAPPVPTMRDTRSEHIRPGTQAYLGMAWHAPRLDHADTPAVDLLVSILGQSRTSRLTQKLREQLGLVNAISAGYSALEAGGLVTITAQLDARNLPQVEGEITRELRRLGAEGVSEAERARAVGLAEARREFQTETAEGRAWLYGRAETVWRLEDEIAYIDRLAAVTLEQIRAVARRYLDPDRYARVAFVPGAAR
jgi:zinc protease